MQNPFQNFCFGFLKSCSQNRNTFHPDFFKIRFTFFITLYIIRNFLEPILLRKFLLAFVEFIAMPEIAINKNRLLRRWNCYVWISRNIFIVPSKTDAFVLKKTKNGLLYVRIFGAYPRHYLASFFLCKYICHIRPTKISNAPSSR